MKKYELIKNKPVAKFYYKGTHTHPVRRVVLIVEETAEWFTGYEVQEGRSVRLVQDAPIKTYSKAKIAKFGDYCRLKMSRKNYSRKNSESTLIRLKKKEFVCPGM